MSRTKSSRGTDSGVRNFAFRALVVGVCGIAAAYAAAFGPPSVAARAPWVMAVALPTTMVALMAIGAVRAGRRAGALAVPFTLVLLMVAGGFLLALALPPDLPAGPYWFGFPRRAAVIVYGVGLLPLFILPVAYALTFRALTLDDADIERVRAARLPAARQPPSETGVVPGAAS